MFEKLKANIMFAMLLRRHDINQAYKMVGPEDSWYQTICTVHNSLAKIRELPHEDLEIVSHDGLKLKAVFYPGTSNKTMIWIHGYTSHAERESAFPGLFYHSLGFNVLIPYLRAHGPSAGKYMAFGALEREDMIRWVEKVNEKIPGGQILLHGLSMGGGVALYMADEEMRGVKGILADAPNTSIPGFFHGVTYGTFKKEKHPERIREEALKRFRKEFSVDAADFDALERIRNGKYPLLLTAGSNEGMEEILERIRQYNPNESTILILPGCNHGNGMYKQTEMYQNAIRKFIDENFER